MTKDPDPDPFLTGSEVTQKVRIRIHKISKNVFQSFENEMPKSKEDKMGEIRILRGFFVAKTPRVLKIKKKRFCLIISNIGKILRHVQFKNCRSKSQNTKKDKTPNYRIVSGSRRIVRHAAFANLTI